MRVFLFCVGVVLSTPIFGQLSAPVYSNEFMQIGVGARALALGGVGTAAGLPEEGGYWNPALLASLQDDAHQISLMHSEYFGGVAAFDYLAYAVQLDEQSAISATFIRMGVDDIPDTRLLYDASGRIDYDAITFFSAADYGFLISYGRQSAQVEGLSFGGSAKIIHRRAGDFTRAWGFGLDLGVLYKKNRTKYGLMLRDVSGTYNAWSHSLDLIDDVYISSGNTLPKNSVEVTLPSLRFGIQQLLFSSENWGGSIMVDLVTTTDGTRNTLIKAGRFSVDPLIGSEFYFKELIFLRVGLAGWQYSEFSNSWMTDVSGGLGVTYDKFNFHYALTRNNGLTENHLSHTFSLNIRWPK